MDCWRGLEGSQQRDGSTGAVVVHALHGEKRMGARLALHAEVACPDAHRIGMRCPGEARLASGAPGHVKLVQGITLKNFAVDGCVGTEEV